jgi:hypothetical protein
MTQSIMLPIPDDLYQRAQQKSDETAQPIEEVLIEWIEGGEADDSDTLPSALQAELDTISLLSDAEVWKIAKEQMSPTLQDRMQVLMNKSDKRTINEQEIKEFSTLVEWGDWITLRKAEAVVVLKLRGYDVTQRDLLPDD